MAPGLGQHLKRIWKQVPLNRLNQGSSLTVRSKIPLHVRIEPSWRDDGLATLSSICERAVASRVPNIMVDQSMDIETSLGRKTAHITIDLQEGDETVSLDTTTEPLQEDGDATPGTYLTIQTPEKINLVCDLSKGRGSISVTEKIEGDVRCTTLDGDITVKKLRGNSVELETKSPGSLIYASSLLETQKLSVKTNGRFRAKQVHANVAVITVDTQERSAVRLAEEQDDEGSRVDISSLFITGNGGASISVQGNNDASPELRAVRIKSHHGPVRIETKDIRQPTTINPHTRDFFPIVELGGVNGSTEVAISDSVHTSETDWSSCLVHIDSLPQDSVSLFTADSGDVSLTLDRKVEADLRFSSLSSKECLKETGELLAEEEDSKLLKSVLEQLPGDGNIPQKTRESISIDTTAFTELPQNSLVANNVAYVEGWVENKSQEPDSRFERKTRGDVGSVGKIRVESAQSQALESFSSTSSGKSYQRPLLAVVGTQKIKVETVSWLGAIARRYGMDDKHKGIGRTAARRGRPIVPQ